MFLANWVRTLPVLFRLRKAKRNCDLNGVVSTLQHLSAKHSRNPHAVDVERARKLERLVLDADARWSLHPGNCLHQSVALYELLRANGLMAEMKFGVRTLTGHFESHAWIEHNSTVLLDENQIAEMFTVMATTHVSKDGHPSL